MIDSSELATRLKTIAETSYHLLIDVAHSPSADRFLFAHQTLWEVSGALGQFVAHVRGAPEVRSMAQVKPKHVWATDLHDAAEHLKWVADGLRTALIETAQHPDEEERAWAAHQILLDTTWALTQLECVHAREASP